MTTQDVKKPVAGDAKKEIEMLKAKLAELEKRQSTLDEKKEVKEEPASDSKIQQDEYIQVMSLLPFNLNLSTKERGEGNVKKFTHFGEVKRILYKDLVDIMEANPDFLHNGFYYILDPRVIRFHGLEEYYSKILTKEKIEMILSANSSDGVSLYSSANPEQQKMIVGIIVAKLFEDPTSVDMNLVDSISRVSGIKISERVESAKVLLEQSEHNEG